MKHQLVKNGYFQTSPISLNNHYNANCRGQITCRCFTNITEGYLTAFEDSIMNTIMKWSGRIHEILWWHLSIVFFIILGRNFKFWGALQGQNHRRRRAARNQYIDSTAICTLRCNLFKMLMTFGSFWPGEEKEGCFDLEIDCAHCTESLSEEFVPFLSKFIPLILLMTSVSRLIIYTHKCALF